MIDKNENKVMNSRNLFKHTIAKQIIFLALVFQSAFLFAQDITISANTNAAAASPLIAGAKGQVVFGITLDKANDPTVSSVTTIVVNLSANPTGRYLNARLFRSSNNAVFDAADVSAATGTFGATSITFTASPLTDFGGNTIQTLRHFFMVVDVDPTVTAATTPIQATVTQAQITATSTVLAGTVTAINYAFADATITINQLTTGIAPDPLGSAATDQALLGFSLTSNGNPDFTDITINTSSNPSGKLSNIRLFKSTNDNSFNGGDLSISTASSVTASTIVFTGLSEMLSGTTSNFFIVADIVPTVNASTPKLELSFDENDVSVSNGTVQPITVTGTDYSFIDAAPPVITARVPLDNATGVTVLLNTLQLTFDENVTFVGDNSDDDHRIRLHDLGGGTFIETIALANVSVAGNTVTITITATLTASTEYAIQIGNSVFEDAVGNAFTGITNDTNWSFTTEASPDISGLSNTTRCIGDQLVINGSGFTGTGGSGNTKPKVRINGVLVPAINVTTYSSTTVSLTVPVGAVTGNVTVDNSDNNLTSNGSALTVNPQINTGLTVTPATLSPAQNTSVNVDVASTQDNNYTYSLILMAAPGAYTPTPPATIDSEVGNNGTGTLNTAPNLSAVGSYTYKIDVSRAGCTTRMLTNTPFTLTVASLSATVSATNTSVCAGSNSILIGSTSGGTGYYQFSWKGPNSFSSNSSSPSITPTHPAGTGWYVLTLSDNSANKAKDSVYITTFPSSTVSFQPVNGSTTVQTEYTNQDKLFELNASPSQLINAGATFSGPGVVALSDSNKYFFNPQLAGNGTHTITYTYFNGNCSQSITTTFRVSQTFIDGLKAFYCENVTTSGDLSLSTLGKNYLSTYYPTYTFTRFRFLKYQRDPVLNFYVFNYYDQPLISKPNPGPQPDVYRLDIQGIKTTHGIAPPDTYYYVVVFGRDSNNLDVTYVDEAVLYNYFRIEPLGLPPNIVGIKELQNICSDAPTITLSQSISGYSINDFDITSPYNASLTGVKDEILKPNHSSIMSSGFDEIPLTITLDYNDLNGCSNKTVRNFNWVKKPSAPIATDTSYCQIPPPGSAKNFTITASPNGSGTNPYWYGTSPVLDSDRTTNPVLDSVNFVFTAPGITGLTPVIKTFYVTQSYKGCEGATKSVDIAIKPAPNANFTTPPICENRDFMLSGPLDISVPYQQYDWTFKVGETISVLNDNQTTYNYGPGTGSFPFTIDLIVTSSRGCISNSTRNITVGLNPKPSFTYNFVCENDITKFSASTDIAVSQYKWEFYDASPVVIGPGAFQNTNYNFASGAGQYKVRATAYTALGCFGTDSTIVSILNYVTHTSDNPYDMSLVDGGRGFWTLEDFKDSTTWEFNIPGKTIIQSTSSAWVTNATGNYKANDASVLNSPCLNISGIQKPVLSMDFISNTQENYDGAVLEYSIDNGETWSAFGQQATGQNWFNTNSFVPGKIGNSLVGWSGDLFEQPSNQWLEARHTIDAFIPLIKRNKLRLRMAFGSNGDDQREGFAFANLSITERNRLILVENFTNESDPLYTTNNTAFKALSTSELVKLQYHLPFPGADAIYPENEADPNARAAYYGISNGAQIIPRVYVDGESNGNLTTNWFTNFAAKRSLKTSPFSITIETIPSANSNELTVSVSAKALRLISNPLFSKPVVHLAIVDTVAGNNEFVLRKLLPNAAGTPIPLPLSKDDSVIVGPFTWSPNFDPSKFAIVAFVQDELTKEVYQAEILKNPTNLPTIITGAELTLAEKVSVFPNPAQGVMNIRLPHAPIKSSPLMMIDNFGRAVYSNEFKIGEQEKSINTSDFASGIYVIQIKTSSGEIVRKKVVITH